MEHLFKGLFYVNNNDWHTVLWTLDKGPSVFSCCLDKQLLTNAKSFPIKIIIWFRSFGALSSILHSKLLCMEINWILILRKFYASWVAGWGVVKWVWRTLWVWEWTVVWVGGRDERKIVLVDGFLNLRSQRSANINQILNWLIESIFNTYLRLGNSYHYN